VFAVLRKYRCSQLPEQSVRAGHPGGSSHWHERLMVVVALLYQAHNRHDVWGGMSEPLIPEELRKMSVGKTNHHPGWIDEDRKQDHDCTFHHLHQRNRRTFSCSEPIVDGNIRFRSWQQRGCRSIESTIGRIDISSPSGGDGSHHGDRFHGSHCGFDIAC